MDSTSLRNKQKYTLDESLALYESHLPGVIKSHPEEFEKLCHAEYIGCFCEDGCACHTASIRRKMLEAGFEVKFQCVKVKFLRKSGWKHLDDWIGEKRVMATRAGRIFIHSVDDATGVKTKRYFRYPASIWANPFPVKMKAKAKKAKAKAKTKKAKAKTTKAKTKKTTKAKTTKAKTKLEHV